MTKRLLINAALAVLTMFATVPARAQFVNDGTEPTDVRWRQITTDNYRVVFPEECEQLGQAYARALEQARIPVGGSLGMVPNQNYKRPMPVILHPYTGYANGMVVWSPRRMELLTLPDAYQPEATPWIWQLAVHENRHVAQMQFGASHKYRYFNYAIGEFFPAFMTGIYPGSTILEGDAVVAETGLSQTGRGRAGDFLEYQRAAFRHGDYRNYWQWTYGSLHRYTPDIYTLGYLTQAGYDYVYTGSFGQKYFDRIVSSRHLFPWFVLQKTAEEMSGIPRFKLSWRCVAENWQQQWDREEQARGPFMEMRPVTRDRAYFKDHKGLVDDGEYMYSVRSGLTEAANLVRIDSTGKETVLCSFSDNASRIRYSARDNRIYWSEYRGDLRWERVGYSDIWYYDIAARKKMRLTSGHRYFNPVPVQGDSLVAVVNYPVEGGSEVVMISSRDGNPVMTYPGCEGLEAVELAVADNMLYATAVTDDGIGIYKVHDWTTVLEPAKCKLSNLTGTPEGLLNFVSDRNGVNEWYRLYPMPRRVMKLTNTPVGATDFVEKWIGDDNWYYYTSLTPKGRSIYRTPVSSTVGQTVTYGNIHKYKVADYLSAHERMKVDENMPVNMSESQPYNKFANAFRFHSWIPLFSDVDEVSALSASNVTQLASLGATAYFQNDLGTLSGLVGFSFGPEGWGENHTGKWYQGGHAKLTYRGLFPVIEASINVISDGATTTVFSKDEEGNPVATSNPSGMLVNGGIKTYVPLNFSSGGWNRGIIPTAQIGFTNSNVEVPAGYLSEFGLGDVKPGATMGRYAVSVSAYSYRPAPSSRYYPEWGGGIQAGVGGYTNLNPLAVQNAFVHLYGYLPGILPTQGLCLTATTQMHITRGIVADQLVSTLPRGYTLEELDLATAIYPLQVKLGVDYAIPFGSIDCSWFCPVAYIRNFELIPHADWVWCHSFKAGTSRTFSSFGADFDVVLGNFLWFQYDTRIGVSYSYCPELDGAPYDHPHNVSLIFAISI